MGHNLTGKNGLLHHIYIYHTQGMAPPRSGTGAQESLKFIDAVQRLSVNAGLCPGSVPFGPPLVHGYNLSVGLDDCLLQDEATTMANHPRTTNPVRCGSTCWMAPTLGCWKTLSVRGRCVRASHDPAGRPSRTSRPPRPCPTFQTFQTPQPAVRCNRERGLGLSRHTVMEPESVLNQLLTMRQTSENFVINHTMKPRRGNPSSNQIAILAMLAWAVV